MCLPYLGQVLLWGIEARTSALTECGLPTPRSSRITSWPCPGTSKLTLWTTRFTWALGADSPMRSWRHGKWKRRCAKIESYIFEVAANMVGGPERAAVQRGAVLLHREGGVDLYSLPSRCTKSSDKVERRVVSEAVADIAEEQHEDMKVCWGEPSVQTVWKIKCLPLEEISIYTSINTIESSNLRTICLKKAYVWNPCRVVQSWPCLQCLLLLGCHPVQALQLGAFLWRWQGQVLWVEDQLMHG